MTYAYHGTSTERLGPIRMNGLIPGGYTSYERYSEYDDGRHLFFTDDPEYASRYGDVLLRFVWPTDAKPDQNMYGRLLSHQFVTKIPVSAQQIEVQVGNDWSPITSLMSVSEVKRLIDTFLNVRI